MPTFEGAIEVDAEGLVRVHDTDRRAFVEFREEDRDLACFLGDEAGIARWSVSVATDAEVSTGELSPSEWEALFVTHLPRSFKEPPSVHNSWCQQCPSVGVSRGVCCP